MSGGYSLDVVAYFPAHGLREESRDILFLIGFILTLVFIFLLLLKVIFGGGGGDETVTCTKTMTIKLY